MKKYDQQLLSQLYLAAEKSERLRSHHLLHDSYDEKVQRILIAMVKGSYVEPHYHEMPNQWEMFTLLFGQIRVCLYNKVGDVIKVFTFDANHSTSIIEFSPHDVHSVECLSEKALLLEIKEGPYDETLAKVLLHTSVTHQCDN